MSIFTKKFFIITAHPDDFEMGCGGLTAKINAHGGSVTNLVLVQPSAETNIQRDIHIVQNELAKSEKVLPRHTIIYDTPLHKNGRPNLQLTNNLITFAEDVSKDHDILISHWREDYHQDHRVCFEVAQSISRKGFEQFWCMDQAPYNIYYKNFTCNLYIDVTDYIEDKINAINCYSSYFDKESVKQIIDYNSYRGKFIGSNKIAETFQQIYNKI